MRPGGDRRGSNRDRAIRKLWMLSQWGDGHTCPCVHCGCELTYKTIEADRIVPGGTYRRENIQPACRRCNASRQDNPKWKGPAPQPRIVPDYGRTIACAVPLS